MKSTLTRLALVISLIAACRPDGTGDGPADAVDALIDASVSDGAADAVAEPVPDATIELTPDAAGPDSAELFEP